MSIVDKYGLTVTPVLLAAFFLTLFGSMANPALEQVAYGIMGVLGLISVVMVGTAMRA
jgi:uncharacterized membrane protein YuzA (DUF378 family)